MTVGICLVQSGLAAWGLYSMGRAEGAQPLVHPDWNPVAFVLQMMLIVTTGSMVLLWIAEQITKFGVGNGVSVVIMISVLGASLLLSVKC